MRAREVAPAFDVFGKRLALRVVRELALGPWRFTDLHQVVSAALLDASCPGGSR
jgi:DNA-binding HxlR family transcriptional regulator